MHVLSTPRNVRASSIRCFPLSRDRSIQSVLQRPTSTPCCCCKSARSPTAVALGESHPRLYLKARQGESRQGLRQGLTARLADRTVNRYRTMLSAHHPNLKLIDPLDFSLYHTFYLIQSMPVRHRMHVTILASSFLVAEACIAVVNRQEVG